MSISLAVDLKNELLLIIVQLLLKVKFSWFGLTFYTETNLYELEGDKNQFDELCCSELCIVKSSIHMAYCSASGLNN